MAYADEKVFLWINGWVGRVSALDRVAEWVVSDYLVPVSLALALVGVWFVGKDRVARQRHQIGVFVALTSMGCSSLVVFTINAMYFRPRPFVDLDVARLFYPPTDSSFPSNAIAAAFGLAAVVWGINRPLGTLLLIGASLYGLARIYAGVHYPLDIIGGALIGAAVSVVMLRLSVLVEPVTTRVIKAARILCLA